MERRNAAYDYVAVYERIGPLVTEAPTVAAWGLHELPLSLYFGRPVLTVATGAELREGRDAHGAPAAPEVTW